MNEIDRLNLLPLSGNLASDIRSILVEARKSTARAISTTMTAAYWLIEICQTLSIKLSWSHNYLKEKEMKQASKYISQVASLPKAIGWRPASARNWQG